MYWSRLAPAAARPVSSWSATSHCSAEHSIPETGCGHVHRRRRHRDARAGAEGGRPPPVPSRRSGGPRPLRRRRLGRRRGGRLPRSTWTTRSSWALPARPCAPCTCAAEPAPECGARHLPQRRVRPHRSRPRAARHRPPDPGVLQPRRRATWRFSSSSPNTSRSASAASACIPDGEIDDAGQIVERVEQAAEVIGAERIVLNPGLRLRPRIGRKEEPGRLSGRGLPQAAVPGRGGAPAVEADLRLKRLTGDAGWDPGPERFTRRRSVEAGHIARGDANRSRKLPRLQKEIGQDATIDHLIRAKFRAATRIGGSLRTWPLRKMFGTAEHWMRMQELRTRAPGGTRRRPPDGRRLHEARAADESPQLVSIPTGAKRPCRLTGEELRQSVVRSLPEVNEIGDETLRNQVIDAWAYALGKSSFFTID